MEINTIPEAFQTKLRLSIISALLSGELSFKELKKSNKFNRWKFRCTIIKIRRHGIYHIKKRIYQQKTANQLPFNRIRYKFIQRICEHVRNFIKKFKAAALIPYAAAFSFSIFYCSCFGFLLSISVSTFRNWKKNNTAVNDTAKNRRSAPPDTPPSSDWISRSAVQYRSKAAAG